MTNGPFPPLPPPAPDDRISAHLDRIYRVVAAITILVTTLGVATNTVITALSSLYTDAQVRSNADLTRANRVTLVDVGRKADLLHTTVNSNLERMVAATEKANADARAAALDDARAAATIAAARIKQLEAELAAARALSPPNP